MKKKKFIIKTCLVLLLLMSPFKTKMMADPIGNCDLLSLSLLVPDDSDCTVYYICVKVGQLGVFIKNTCPGGLQF
ncbi:MULTISPECIES: carbohydrate-binding module family 14 protein [Flavobacterium]|uniref:carbohydrate-binding module family 14 protein n=1 Tax=Flavobacterium TaxID=237 RepID=UPI001182B136|nr:MULTISPECIES: carbohydrate-binding module family 14 protein [Flavobacterium]MCR4029835.1 carbohydrate-binding module family 14 protein [Flavobacterium panacis]